MLVKVRAAQPSSVTFKEPPVPAGTRTEMRKVVLVPGASEAANVSGIPVLWSEVMKIKGVPLGRVAVPVLVKVTVKVVGRPGT